MKRFFCLYAIFILFGSLQINGEVKINFDDSNTYESISIYDVWEESPFRTGELKGNWTITQNPIEDKVNHTDTIGMVLGAQRSRFGSNRFGIRIDLKESFKLSPETQYVHVMLNKPIEGRTMLVGLGSREERKDQNPYTEQFWVLSETEVLPGVWSDAVFPIRGAEGIDIRSLVVIPDCESRHNLNEDFLFYIDNITIDSSAATRTPFNDNSFTDEIKYETEAEDIYVTINDSQLNGEILSADGSKLDSYKILLNKDFKIKVSPEKGFHNGGVDIYVFRNFDRIVNINDTSKAEKYHITPEQFDKDNTYIIPADMIKGNVLIHGIMIENKAK